MFKECCFLRIFVKDGKFVILVLDGYYFFMKINGIDNMINQFFVLVEYGLDCVFVMYGMLKNYWEVLNSVFVVLCVDSMVSIFDNIVFDIIFVFFVEDVFKVVVEGVVCMIFFGVFNEEKIYIMVM